MPTRSALAVWTGDLNNGKGTVKLGSGAYEGPYSFSSRFEEGTGTNPEELIGAAHAGCFSMALAARLGREGHNVKSIQTTAKVQLDRTDAGMKIVHITLVTEGSVEGIDDAYFKEAAEAAKEGCIVSQALAATPMSVEATLLHTQD